MIYLDNSATSFPKAPGLAEGVAWHLANVAGNTGRSSYSGAVKNSMIIYQAREQIANLLGGVDSSQVIFTNNATMALNAVILGSIKENEKILISPLEHNSVMRPLAYLKEKKNIQFFTYDMDHNFKFDSASFKKQIESEKIDKVITSACSNVVGNIINLQEISQICSQAHIPLIVDASQLIGYEEIDLAKTPVSAICFPGHKGLLGPSGTGALWYRDDFDFEPLYFGGTGSKSESINQPDFSPDKYESGTPNISGIYGLSKALDYLIKKGIQNIRKERKEITTYLLNQLADMEEVVIYSNQDIERQIGVISINIKNIPCSEVVRILDRKQIAVRMGLHCAPMAHKFINTLDLGGTVRISPSSFTTKSEIDQTIKVLKEISYEQKINR